MEDPTALLEPVRKRRHMGRHIFEDSPDALLAQQTV